MTSIEKISIITVCFNSVKTIAQTIESVIQQDYPHKEYIIIDGGSTDGTLDVIHQHRSHINRIISEPDQGMYDAMNKGINLAKGDVIGILNSDDLYAGHQVLSQVMAVLKEESIDICYGDLIYFSEHDINQIIRYWQSSAFTTGLFSKGWCPPHPTFFVKRDVYLRYGLFDTSFKLGNDVELMMRFLESHRLQSAHIPQILVKMRRGGVSNQFRNIREQNKNILRAARKLNLPFSPIRFYFYKIINRLSQFIRKPRSV